MAPKQTAPKHRRGSALTSVLMLVILVATGIAFIQRDALYDWYRLRGYVPPAAIAQLASDTTMTDYAEHMFYVNRPEQKERGTFTQFCPAGTEQSVVLGCYKGGQNGIYLLRVPNAELAGVEQVTAAHEMLHAAYERLSVNDRNSIDAQLQDYYQTKLTDQTIKDTIDEYKRTEPNDVVNEMHSIFATQIADLPEGLQTYYQKYFTNRATVTNYYATYEAAFTTRQQQIKQSDAQLDAWKSQINELEANVTAQQNNIDQQRTALNTARNSGNIDSYNAGVDSFNSAVVAYNADVKRLQGLIKDYNDLVNTRNSIAFEQRELVQSLSSATTTEQ